MSDPRSPDGVSAYPLSAITNMDAVVDHLKGAAVTGHLQLNPLAPGNINARLPREIFCEIFLCLARQCWATSRTLPYGWGVYEWLIVTYVCRYWRDLARDFGGLWTRIETLYGPEDLVMEFLLLSKKWPLSIRCSEKVGGKDSDEDGNLDLVLNEMHRTWSFCGRMSASDQLLRVQQALSNAPLLEVLHLTHSREFKSAGQLDGPVGPLSTPMLRELHLRKPTTAILQAFVCPLLTDMRLYSFDASLEALREFPLLEQLVIYWRCGFSLAAGLPTKPIPFMRLQKLVMAQPLGWNNCSSFLEWVTLPCDVRVIMILEPDSLHTDAYAPFYQALSSIQSGKTIEPTRHPVRCYVERNLKRDSQLAIWYGDSSVDRPISLNPAEHKNGQLRIRWSNEGGGDESKVLSAVLAFLYHPFSSHLHTFTMCNFEIDRIEWGSMTAKNLRILGINSIDICSTLQQFIPDRSAEPSTDVRAPGKTLLFPHLEALVLTGINLNMHTELKGESPIQKLRALVQFRGVEGHPLKWLAIMNGRDMCRNGFESFRSSETGLQIVSQTPGDQFFECHCAGQRAFSTPYYEDQEGR